MTMSVRPVTEPDEAAWRELFRGYREFYRLPESETVVSRVWSWLMDPAHESRGFVAESGGRVVGIGNYRAFARPSTGTTGLWLDDLFTHPESRGTGAGRAILDRLAELAAAEGHSVVRWITAEDNQRAQALYDTAATRTHWVVYDAVPAP